MKTKALFLLAVAIATCGFKTLMKTKLFFLSVLLCSALAVQAQSKNSLRVGTNAAFWGAGDAWGTAFYGEYERAVTPFMAVVPRVSVGYSHNQVQLDNQPLRSSVLASQTVSASLRFTPFPWKVINRLKLDVGFLYQHTATSAIGYSSVPSFLTTSAEYHVDNLLGFLFAVNINLLQTDRHELGIRGEILTSIGHTFDCDGLQYGVYYGVKF